MHRTCPAGTDDLSTVRNQLDHHQGNIKPANLGYESLLSVGDIWLDSNNLKTVLGAQSELFPETALHIARHLCLSASTFLPSQLHNLFPSPATPQETRRRSG
jgi:hypothetical protein